MRLSRSVEDLQSRLSLCICLFILTLPLRFVGPYLDLCRDLSFVLEDTVGVCGYVLAALDSTEFYRLFKEQWLPKVLPLYPTPPSGGHCSPEMVSGTGSSCWLRGKGSLLSEHSRTQKKPFIKGSIRTVSH